MYFDGIVATGSFSSYALGTNNHFSFLPLPERDAVHLYDAVLHQGLGSDQLIVAGIVYHIQDTTLAGDSYRRDKIQLFQALPFTLLGNLHTILG